MLHRNIRGGCFLAGWTEARPSVFLGPFLLLLINTVTYIVKSSVLQAAHWAPQDGVQPPLERIAVALRRLVVSGRRHRARTPAGSTPRAPARGEPPARGSSASGASGRLNRYSNPLGSGKSGKRRLSSASSSSASPARPCFLSSATRSSHF